MASRRTTRPRSAAVAAAASPYNFGDDTDSSSSSSSDDDDDDDDSIVSGDSDSDSDSNSIDNDKGNDNDSVDEKDEEEEGSGDDQNDDDDDDDDDEEEEGSSTGDHGGPSSSQQQQEEENQNRLRRHLRSRSPQKQQQQQHHRQHQPKTRRDRPLRQQQQHHQRITSWKEPAEHPYGTDDEDSNSDSSSDSSTAGSSSPEDEKDDDDNDNIDDSSSSSASEEQDSEEDDEEDEDDDGDDMEEDEGKHKDKNNTKPVKTTTATATAGGHNTNKDNKKDKDKDKDKRQRRKWSKQQEILDQLQQEMEVTGYVRGKNGQTQKKIPRHLSKIRRAKWQKLERADKFERYEDYNEYDEYDENENENEYDSGHHHDDEDDDDDDEEEKGRRRRRGGEAESRNKRKRGGRAALDDDIIQDTMIFRTTDQQTSKKTSKLTSSSSSSSKRKSDEPSADGNSADPDTLEEPTKGHTNSKSNIGDSMPDDDDAVDVEVDDDDEMGIDGEEESDGDDEIDDHDDDDEKVGDEASKKSHGAATTTTTTKTPTTTTKKKKRVGRVSSRTTASSRKRRRLYRMRNFVSMKLSQKHGDALAAHARGDHRLAIEKLKAVAKERSDAPQVYSSLGMVYEDLLKASRRKYRNENTDDGDDGDGDDDDDNDGNEDNGEPKSDDPSEQTKPSATSDAEENGQGKSATTETPVMDSPGPVEVLSNHLKLAEKSYGAYHISAILCKKDYSLWVRAADMATTVAGIHGEMTTLDCIDEQRVHFHRSEKQRWQSEAMRDISVADNLKPPGIDIPCKLASLHMELGNLSQALTIIVDLKKRAGKSFQTSTMAWMLYSDLMLRLGHECVQWNRGNKSNQNYLARRWLRKFSKDFNWRERRIQALSLALETAAGTSSTVKYMSWMRQRTIEMSKTMHESQEERNTNETRYHTEKGDDDEDGAENGTETGESLPRSATKELLGDQEKRLLLERHQIELEAFDKTTADMELTPGSEPAKDRAKVRASLVTAYSKANTSLSKEFDRRNQVAKKPNDREDSYKEILGMNSEPVPPSGSIREVCKIASDLMKHLNGLELSDGAQLVGEAVSSYLKERAKRIDKALFRKKKEDEWHQKVSKSPFTLGTFDEDHESDNDSNNDDNVAYISDDDHLMNSGDDGLLASLRSGALPPELRVMYGLSLLVVGNRNFIAANCLRDIDNLTPPSMSWLTNGEKEVTLSGDPLWVLFNRAMTEPLSQTSAYAFLVDILSKQRKEEQWASHFGPDLRHHVGRLREAGLLYEFQKSEEFFSENMRFRKSQAMKVICASCRYDMHCVKLSDGSQVKPALRRTRAPLGEDEKVKIALSTMSTLSDIIPMIWAVDKDGILSSGGIEAVEIAAACIQRITSSELKDFEEEDLQRLLSDTYRILSYFCGIQVNVMNDDGNDKILEVFSKSNAFPFQSTWQSNVHNSISTRAFNLAVACNVAVYPGWQLDAFDLKSVIKQYGAQHFGVQYSGPRLVGLLPDTVHKELKRQWKVVHALEPMIPLLDVEEAVRRLDKLEWCTKEKNHRQITGINEQSTVEFAENSGIKFLLSLSWLSLSYAKNSTDTAVCNQMKSVALSTLMPLTQFCLDVDIWDSMIGRSRKLDIKAASKPVEQVGAQVHEKEDMSETSTDVSMTSNNLLSDYEQHRARNIEENNKRLRELGLITALEEQTSNGIAWGRENQVKRKHKERSNKHRVPMIEEIEATGAVPIPKPLRVARTTCSTMTASKTAAVSKATPKPVAARALERTSTRPTEEEVQRQVAAAVARIEAEVRVRRIDEIEASGAAPVPKPGPRMVWRDPAQSYGHATIAPTIGRVQENRNPNIPSRDKVRRPRWEPGQSVKVWVEEVQEGVSASAILIPVREMKNIWFSDHDRTLSTEADKETMKKVHESVTNLRKCYTVSAAERVCLQISVLLLEAAVAPSCHDPFTCIMHAASYACQAPKAGKNDLVYRHPLPETALCSPLDALVALGRADCLHSIDFPTEAAFICSYVARVCCLHRDKKRTAFVWNDRWKLVGIYAHYVSVLIRSTVMNSSSIDQRARFDFMKMWSLDVIEELDRGRNDAKQLKQRLSKDGLDTTERFEKQKSSEKEGTKTQTAHEGRQDGDDGDEYEDDENIGTMNARDDDGSVDPDHEAWRGEMVDSVVEEVFGGGGGVAMDHTGTFLDDSLNTNAAGTTPATDLATFDDQIHDDGTMNQDADASANYVEDTTLYEV